MRNKAFRNIKFMFTVIATYPSDTKGRRPVVFRVQSTGGWRQVTEKFEAVGFKVLSVHRDGDER